MKNVAGYDLCKLLIGLLGTLAIITQLTFKVKPVPEATGLLWLSLNTLEEIDQALDKLSTTATRPVAVEVLDARGYAPEVVAKAEIDLPHHLPVLCLGLEGTAREVQWQADTLNNELAAGPGPASRSTLVSGAQAAALWDSLVDFAVPADDPLTFRANLRPSKTIAFIQQASNAGVTLQAHAGNGIVIGHLPDGVTTAAAAKSLLGPLQASARAAAAT